MSKKLSRDEQLDEAIAKAKAAEDWQLVEWLRAARGSEESARWFTLKLRDVRDENRRMRELLRGLYGFAYQEYPDSAEENFAEELRELGVEVNEIHEVWNS